MAWRLPARSAEGGYRAPIYPAPRGSARADATRLEGGTGKVSCTSRAPGRHEGPGRGRPGPSLSCGWSGLPGRRPLVLRRHVGLDLRELHGDRARGRAAPSVAGGESARHVQDRTHLGGEVGGDLRELLVRELVQFLALGLGDLDAL